MTDIYFKSAPDGEEAYKVGDQVEVYCDHDRDGERVRDWLSGTVVQVDLKLIAVQFQQDIYLTDGKSEKDQITQQKIPYLKKHRAEYSPQTGYIDDKN